MIPFVPTFSTAKLIAMGVGALALVAAFFWIKDAFDDRRELLAWQGEIVSAVQSEVPVERRKLVKPRTVADEIHWLGREYRTASSALASQSEKLRIAEGKTLAAQNTAANAARSALEADKPRKAIRDRLTAQERAGGLLDSEWEAL